MASMAKVSLSVSAAYWCTALRIIYRCPGVFACLIIILQRKVPANGCELVQLLAAVVTITQHALVGAACLKVCPLLCPTDHHPTNTPHSLAL